MTKAECIAILDGLDGDDQEADHSAADDALLEYLRGSGAADVAAAFERVRDRVGFWYA